MGVRPDGTIDWVLTPHEQRSSDALGEQLITCIEGFYSTDDSGVVTPSRYRVVQATLARLQTTLPMPSDIEPPLGYEDQNPESAVDAAEAFTEPTVEVVEVYEVPASEVLDTEDGEDLLP